MQTFNPSFLPTYVFRVPGLSFYTKQSEYNIHSEQIFGDNISESQDPHIM